MKYPPHIELISAVVMQAVRDAEGPKYVNTWNRERKCRIRVKNDSRQQARDWLFDINSTLNIYLSFLPEINPEVFRIDLKQHLTIPKVYRIKRDIYDNNN